MSKILSVFVGTWISGDWWDYEDDKQTRLAGVESIQPLHGYRPSAIRIGPNLMIFKD
jgi:hypothetical protein